MSGVVVIGMKLILFVTDMFLRNLKQPGTVVSRCSRRSNSTGCTCQSCVFFHERIRIFWRSGTFPTASRFRFGVRHRRVKKGGLMGSSADDYFVIAAGCLVLVQMTVAMIDIVTGIKDNSTTAAAAAILGCW